MAHSKRNTSLPHFTAHERSLLRETWGTKRTRLTRDSFLPFSSCYLCLLPARAPVVACAASGDIFCRECAVNNLLAQHKEIKRIEKGRDMALREQSVADDKLAEEVREKELQEFEQVNSGLVGKKRTLHETSVDEEGREDVPEQDGSRKRRKDFHLDEDEVRRNALREREKYRKELQEEKTNASKSKLPSFWVPSLTPSVDTPDQKPPKLAPICPASPPEHEHHYSLKTLITVHFTEAGDEKTGEKSRICPSCRKALSNNSKAMLTKPCGHVLCKSCVDQFMQPHVHPDPHSTEQERPNRILCYVCETDVTESKSKKPKKIQPGLVALNSEGTGFAGGGKNMAQKTGTAFQC